MKNNKLVIGAVTLGILAASSFSSHADLLFGVHGEVQYWQAKNSGSFGSSLTNDNWSWKDEGATRLSLSFNHFLPFIPNVMVERQLLKSTGTLPHIQDYTFGNTVYPAPVGGAAASLITDWDLGHDTLTLYYRLFDNSLIEFYFGVSAKKFNGDMLLNIDGTKLRRDIDETIPMGYLRLTAGLPLTGLSIRAQGHPVSLGDHDSYDMEASLRYEFLDTLVLDGVLSVGYRTFSIKLDNATGLYSDFEVKGPFVNLSLHF
ncbi:TIGR04219 family outer membrane beta-barrel protein [Aliidiomarina quisquiliarum]|uniref:TIGR04219 family outer membrane beta-barrel protein n=1 Tax=Aliidiomarina quisquiliarum TaxID=2938947 RepID=UPI00208E00CB|nr:TIGR04219 family outer membrane beta-barrel protein [Aliidiomarina quisquiliarum]MCO4322594.1 TIGR04219 family outer membrane beta-barrel protein [Aliidiomarina quisquiliarum]